jgi:hypothetical protein
MTERLLRSFVEEHLFFLDRNRMADKLVSKPERLIVRASILSRAALIFSDRIYVQAMVN